MSKTNIDFELLLKTVVRDENIREETEADHSLSEVRDVINGFYGRELNDMEYLLRQLETMSYILRKQLVQIKTGSLLPYCLDDEAEKYLVEKELYEREKNIFRLDMGYQSEIFEIQIPAVLPHRKTKPTVVYYEALDFGLQEFISENSDQYSEIRKNTQDGAVIVVQHSYFTSYMIRDNDNVEIKQVIDLLHIHKYILSDRGQYLKIFLTAEQEKNIKEDHTTILLMSKRRFQTWITAT